MNSTLFYCLSHLGRGNASEWRRGADNIGGFTLSDEHAPYWCCMYSQKGIVLHQRAGGDMKFTPAMCDAVANKVKTTKQLNLFA